MISRVYFIKASIGEGEEAISEGPCLIPGRRIRAVFSKERLHRGEGSRGRGQEHHVPQGSVSERPDRGIDLSRGQTVPHGHQHLYTGRRPDAIDHTILAAERGFGVGSWECRSLPPTVCSARRRRCRSKGNWTGRSRSLPTSSVASRSFRLRLHRSLCRLHGDSRPWVWDAPSRKGKMRQHSALKPQVKKGP